MAELLFTLYLLSGIAKVFIKFFLGDGMAERNKIYIARGSLPVITMLVIFYGWMIMSLLYTASSQYSYVKTFLFLTTLVAFLFPLTYKGFNFQRFVKYFIYTGSVFIVLYLALVPRSYSAYMSENLEISGKYLDIGYLAALNVLLLLLLMPHLAIKRWLKLGFIGINLAAVVITGARGPQVFMFIALFMYVLSNPKIIFRFLGHLDLKKILIIGISFIILAVGLYKTLGNYMDNIERNLQRLSLVTDIESSSLSVRFDQMYFAVASIFENAANFLFGSGIGSFGILYAGEDVRLYPHNMILETWFEMGVVGVIILLLFFLFYLKKIKIKSPSFFIFFYLFLNSLKSSSLVDLRIMFGILACMAVFTNYLKYSQNGECVKCGK